MEFGELFKGIAVVVDDEVSVAESEICKIISALQEQNCAVVTFSSLPSEKTLESLRSAAFFVLDWNMHNIPSEEIQAGVRIPATVSREDKKKNVSFIKKIQEIKFSPIFIFTQEPIEDVKEVLDRSGIPKESYENHILVVSKTDVLRKGAFRVMEEWLHKVPSAYVLKAWEQEYEKTKNSFFSDFYSKSPAWPLILWKTAKEDGVNPSMELGTAICQNLTSRMKPFEFNLEPYVKKVKIEDSSDYEKQIKSVLEGQLFIDQGNLHNDSVNNGDIFKTNGDYFINIRPECDCIPGRTGKETEQELELYLLKGQTLTNTQASKIAEKKFGLLREKEYQVVIYPIHNGKFICFNLNKVYVKKWTDLKEKRIGRLIGPSLVKMQQKFASYMQRPGMHRIPAEILPSMD